MKKDTIIQNSAQLISTLGPDAIDHWSNMVVSLIESCQLMPSPPFEESPFIGLIEVKLRFDIDGAPVMLWIKRGYK